MTSVIREPSKTITLSYLIIYLSFQLCRKGFNIFDRVKVMSFDLSVSVPTIYILFCLTLTNIINNIVCMNTVHCHGKYYNFVICPINIFNSTSK